MALKVTFAVDRATPNTIKFAEVTDPEDYLAQAKIGSLYIPKHTLKGMGWNGENLTVNVTTA